jgi:hypothetical protein
MEEKRDTYRDFIRNLKAGDYLEDLEVDGMILLQGILKKYGGKL